MIITSLLDTDLYKFTMMQVVLHHFPAAQVEYRFKCRNAGVDLTPYVDEIREEVAQLCQVRFTPDELQYLRELRFIKSDFVDFLGLFHLNEIRDDRAGCSRQRRDRDHHSRAVAAYHPVRGAVAGHRQRSLFPPHPTAT